MLAPGPSLLRALLVALLTAGGAAHAQTHVSRDTGPFASLDLTGGPFVLELEQKVLGGTAGYRFGRGADLALRFERAPTVLQPEFGIPGQTLVGAEGGLSAGSERSPVRLALAVGVVWDDQSGRVQFSDGGSDYRGGRRLTQTHVALSATRHVTLASRPVRFMPGAGLFGEIRRLRSRDIIYTSPQGAEETFMSDAVTEMPFGVVLTAPMAVRLGPRAGLVLEPTLRFDMATSLLGGGPDAYVALRVDL